MARKQLGAAPANPSDDVTKSYADSVNTTGSAAKLTNGRTISITGDLAYTSPSFDGSGNVTAAGTLATVNASPGTTGSATQVTQLTTNGKGLVTANSNVSIQIAESQVTNLTSDLGLKANLASPTFTGTVTLPTSSPSAALEAASKGYVDSVAVGVDWKASVRAATTASGTLASSFANGSTIDGVALVTGDRILIKNQITGSENGIYIVAASGAPTRSTDATTGTQVNGGLAVFVEEGTVNDNTGWVLTNNGAVTVGSTALTFTQFTGLGSFTVDSTLTQSGNQLSRAAISGDIAISTGSNSATLATVNASPGSTGSATQSSIVTTNAKGLVTSNTNVTITPAVGSITGLGTGVATALGVNVGTAGAPVVNGGALGTPSSGVATNLTGTASGLTAGSVTTNANLTGDVTSSGNATTYANVVPASKGGAGSVSGILKANGSGTVSQATVGSDYAPATSGTAALKGSGSGGFGAATLNDVATATADYSIGGFKLTNIATPTSSTDAANKSYVDSAGGSFKVSVRVSTTGSETFTISSGLVTQIAGTTIDGVSVAAGDRILIKDAPASTGTGSVGSTQPGNGIYTVSSVSSNILVARASDMSSGNPQGTLVAVEAGATLPGWIFQVSNPIAAGAFTYNTTSMAWGIAYSNNLVVTNYVSTGTVTMSNKTLTAPVISTIVNTGTLTLPTSTDTLVGRATTDTLTNKWIQPRPVTATVASTYTIDVTAADSYIIGTQNANITNITTTGSAVESQRLVIRIKSDATPRTIAWDSSKFVSSGVAALLSTTVASKTHVIAFMYDGVLGKFVCLACDNNGY